MTLPTMLRHTPPTLRVRSPCAAHSVDHAAVLAAAGLQGPIQATRDFTSATFAAVQGVALPLLLVSAVYLGFSAWKRGQEFRERAAGSALVERDLGFLAACLAIDLVGNGSFFFDFGDASDVLWAPVSAFIVNALFDSPPLAAINALKELLPLADILPVATLGWLIAYAYPDSALARALGLQRLPARDEKDDGFT